MSRKFTPARHRATPTTSIALQGLSYSLKSNAASVAKPAAAAAVASGLLFGAGAPAHAGAYAPETPDAAAQSVAGQALAAPAAAGRALAAPATPAAPAPAGGGSAVAGASHTVEPGDTLGAIAARHGVSLDALLAENGLSLASVIYPGDQIFIPGPGAAAAPAVPAAPAAPAVPEVPAAPAAPAAPAVPEPTGMGIYNASASITPAATAPAASGAGAAIVASARAQLGATQDCTVLVEQALRSVGKSVGDLAPAQFHQYGTPVSAPQPGDLIISAGHVGVYIGGGQAISSGMNGVNETIVHPASWLTGSTYVRVNA
ncbi:C40 family peptidase [Arthrobacter globiformis]|uniref:C40 family peptidase n=1 Tax=Arthrobacter globiformis TaxID=1665 RepID=UPI00278B8257|nr:LysM peptidoglycan-binding domain-containing protein [Arthrobacter globiformis]MDQ0862560.1 LysM repeat protein [Arthrobacter globiformis]